MSQGNVAEDQRLQHLFSARYLVSNRESKIAMGCHSTRGSLPDQDRQRYWHHISIAASIWRIHRGSDEEEIFDSVKMGRAVTA
jgi:hypothetical protein